MAESRTLSNDPFKVLLAADFILQVQLLLRELVFEIGDFAVGQRVFHANGDLLCDLRKKRHILLIERVLRPARHCEYTKRAISTDKSGVAERIHTLASRLGKHFRRYFTRIQPVQNPRFSTAEGVADLRALDGNQMISREDPPALWEVEGMLA